MFNKFLKRIKSIEEYLGIVFAPGDGKDAYPQHVADGRWALAERVKDLEKRLDEMNKTAGTVNNSLPPRR